ncbi:hypothetical protein KAH94_05415, partial [bacterium]|nr:hypothetical protein [bacterium]
MLSFLKRRKFLFSLLFSGGFFIIFFSPVSAAEIGETFNFFVDSIYDWQGREQVTGTLREISDTVYFYIEDEYWESLTRAQQNLYLDYLDDAGRDFDDTTYPSVRYVFGSEWRPGIDGEDRITIFLTRLKSTAGGYFNSKDELLQSQHATSNEKEMFYINSTQVA